MNVLVCGEEAEATEDVNDSADSDIPEEVFRSLCPAAPGFMDFAGSNRLREGKFGVFDHSAAHQGNEEYAKNAADHDEGGSFPVDVPVRNAERRPCACENESGNREDSAGCYAFADGSRSAGDVFFEDASLPDTKH